MPKRDSERRSFNSDKAAKARYLLGDGSLEQALLLAEQALAEDEGSADTHLLAASILDQRGEWQAPLAHLWRAHELMPDGPQVRLNLAMALLRLGSYHEGLPLYEARLDKTTWSGFATLESRTALRHFAAWRSRLAAAGRPGAAKIGLVFQANPEGAGFSDKSMQLSDIAPLLALEGIDIVNLQYGAAGRTLAAAAPGIIDPGEAALPLDEYGAALAATDLLITVDAMAAHLSGALGHAVWVAVPHSPHWVWGLDGGTTPWYPAARIFRQHSHRDWSKPIEALAGALRARLAAAISTAEDGHVHDQAAPRSNLRAQRSRRSPSARTDFAATADKNFLRSEAARLELGLTQLRQGLWEEGFSNHEARQNVPLWSEQALPLRESLAPVRERQLQPGDPLDRRRIVVFTEQGLGDTFFGARFLGILAERGAAVTLICRAPMRPFFARLAFLDAILSPPEDAPHAKIDLRLLSFDAFCPLLSLPHALGVAREDTLPPVSYLRADPIQVEAWRARYQRLGRSGHRKVGVVWQANPGNRFLPHRSMRAQDLMLLAQIEGIDLVNLQSSSEGRELARFAPDAIDPLRAPLALDEFAAALAATDVTVSVDTMAAHCAGALGRPVLVMLTDAPAWYWAVGGDKCRWYPSARLFRRGAGADWAAAVEAVAAVLRAGRTEPHSVSRRRVEKQNSKIVSLPATAPVGASARGMTARRYPPSATCVNCSAADASLRLRG